jgi:hypothetical protein
VALLQHGDRNVRNNAAKTRGRPFAKGNPGRPKGARHRATLAAEALLDGEAEALTRKAIEAALRGDPIALRLCLDRILPPRRERPLRFALPPMNTAADAVGAMAAIAAEVANAEITPGEANDLASLVLAFVNSLQVNEFDQRLRFLEEGRNDAGSGTPPQGG